MRSDTLLYNLALAKHAENLAEYLRRNDPEFLNEILTRVGQGPGQPSGVLDSLKGRTGQAINAISSGAGALKDRANRAWNEYGAPVAQQAAQLPDKLLGPVKPQDTAAVDSLASQAGAKARQFADWAGGAWKTYGAPAAQAVTNAANAGMEGASNLYGKAKAGLQDAGNAIGGVFRPAPSTSASIGHLDPRMSPSPGYYDNPRNFARVQDFGGFQVYDHKDPVTDFLNGSSPRRPSPAQPSAPQPADVGAALKAWNQSPERQAWLAGAPGGQDFDQFRSRYGGAA